MANETKETTLSVDVLGQREMLAEVPPEKLQEVVDKLKEKHATTVSRVGKLSEAALTAWLGDLGYLVFAAFRTPSPGLCFPPVPPTI